MRKSCLECVVKHLGSAAVYIEECELGYPDYYGYAYGELNHAASECRFSYPDLAWAIREHRIKWAESRNSEKPHQIPFEAMFAFISTLEDSGDAAGDIAVPEEVLAGLDKDEGGHPRYSMDTRP